MTARTKQELYDRFSSGGSAKKNISQRQQEFEDLIDTFYGTWINYVDQGITIVGWASYTTVEVYYRTIGNMVFVQFKIDGTSNTTTATFTLPYAMTADLTHLETMVRAMDNGSWQAAGVGELGASSSTFSCYSAQDGSAFTNSGQKIIAGEFFYEKA